MKTTIKNSLIPLILLTVILTASMKCKKEPTTDPDGLPKATQTGADIFACKVNGENWISKKFRNNISGGIANDTTYVQGALDKEDYFEVFIIKLQGQYKTGNTVKLNEPSRKYCLYTTTKDCFLVDHGYGVGISKSSAGEVTFTKIDTVRKILSGTFWFDIPTDKCGILKITDGRFDIRYY